MSIGFEQRVRFREVADRGAEVSGCVPLAACTRLAQRVESAPAHIAATLRLALREGAIVVAGTIEAELALPCRRCLEPLALRIQGPIKLAILADETQLAPEGCEPFLAPDGEGRLADLVEEELLLALPEYPEHARPGDCGLLARRLTEHAPPEDEGRPFRVLRDLKTKRN